MGVCTAMPRATSSSLLALLLALLGCVPGLATERDTAGCATTLAQLRILWTDPALPLRWEETSMDDGKPLVVTIAEEGGTLHLQFVKTGEGLWAESAAAICPAKDGALETRFSRDQIKVGPAAGWLMRQSLGVGGRFTLSRLPNGQLRIATRGWKGQFAAAK